MTSITLIAGKKSSLVMNGRFCTTVETIARVKTGITIAGMFSAVINGAMLCEDGTFLLCEDGSYLLFD